MPRSPLPAHCNRPDHRARDGEHDRPDGEAKDVRVTGVLEYWNAEGLPEAELVGHRHEKEVTDRRAVVDRHQHLARLFCGFAH